MNTMTRAQEHVCYRVTIEAMSAAFFAPGYNNDGCASLPVAPPSAIQGLLAAATGDPDEAGFAGWRMTFTSFYEDYEKIVPARRLADADNFEPFRGGYRLARTPVKRSYLIEPRLTLYVERRHAESLCAPYHAIRLGRSQDLAWVSEAAPATLQEVSEADVQGVTVPFPLPAGGMAAFLWSVPSRGSGYAERHWDGPRPFAFLSARQHLTGLDGRGFYLDHETGLAVPFYEV